MKYPVFKLEEYMGKYEFTAPYLLCCSDAETFTVKDILDNCNDPADLDLWSNLSLGYTEVKGLPALREQICKSFYPSLHKDQVLCFVGAEEGIYCALNALCKPEDHVIVHTPCYQSLAEIPKQCGSEVTEIELSEQNQWKIDIPRLKNTIKSNTKLIIMNFPHNPTGQIITPEEMIEVTNLCREHDIWLFSDEVYRLLGNPTIPWAPTAATIYEKALSLGVMSKSFGLAGLRIGWIACQHLEILQQLEFSKHYLSICNSAPAEIISLMVLKQMNRLLHRNNMIVNENLRALNQFVMEYSHLFEWILPQGGCVGFMRYKGKQSIDSFCHDLIQKKGVLLLPATQFQHSQPLFRIGFGRRNMKESLQRLKEYVDEYER